MMEPQRMYHVKWNFEKRLIPRAWESLIYIKSKDKDETIYFLEICCPKNDPPQAKFIETWTKKNIEEFNVEFKEVGAKDLPLYMDWHKSSAWDKIWKGELPCVENI